ASPTFEGIPEIDFSDPRAAGRPIVEACEELGFFKLVNHGVPTELSSCLENESLRYFDLPQTEKERLNSSPPVYGNKYIGRNGDVGCLEFLLFTAAATLRPPHLPPSLLCAVEKYREEIRGVASRVLEMMAAELRIFPGNKLSDMINDKRNDSCFRINRYQQESRNLVGFGEHTDPQLISVARSNSIGGLEIQSRGGAWAGVPPDEGALFFNVGDCLEVMTGGRFRSVRHRVVVASGGGGGGGQQRSRVSMIFFGAPPPSAKIEPLIGYYEGGGFTWSEYKRLCDGTRLSDDRLAVFVK
ncbi:gibberellin 2-oxidase 5, partial [Genlisea aurea]